jgi:hypothetical protein
MTFSVSAMSHSGSPAYSNPSNVKKWPRYDDQKVLFYIVFVGCIAFYDFD